MINNYIYELFNVTIIIDFKVKNKNLKTFEEIVKFIKKNKHLQEKLLNLNNVTITLSDKKYKFLESFKDIVFYVKGKCNINTNEIFLDFNKKDIIMTFLHEVGHLYYNIISEEHKNKFYEIYKLEEKYNTYVINDIDEFFAEGFTNYILKNNYLLIPKTIDFINSN